MNRLRGCFLLSAAVVLVLLSLSSPAIPQAAMAAPKAGAQSAQAATASPAPTPAITEYKLPPDKLAKATALYHTRILIAVWDPVFGIVLLVLLLWVRLAPRYRNVAERASRYRFVQALIFVPLFILTMDVLSLPFEMYKQHVQRAYGLSVQGWGSWFGDMGKNEAITLIIGIPMIWLLFAIIRKSAARWWFYFWLICVPFAVFLIFVEPVIIDPLFNKFEPLEKAQPQLVQPLQDVAHRGGLEIPVARMYEMKASEKVTTYNAYVTGIGATKRIVVWDNTAKDMTIPQTQFVFGHEMGHYVLNHIYKLLAFFLGLLFIMFWLGRRIALGFLARWGGRWDIRDIADYAALPALLLVLNLLFLVGNPIVNTFSRHVEHDADIHGLEVTHGLVPESPQVAAQAFQKLGEKAYSYPTPNSVFVFCFANHPPIPDRVKFALGYHPWDEGKPNQFVK
ncbi:MAG: M48 family metallopeptidase [Candidatus Sulfotelmatobacter sp.]